MDGRNVFDILSWEVRCLTSYRSWYKKSDAENIRSSSSSKTVGNAGNIPAVATL